jgi:hypothetical protein
VVHIHTHTHTEPAMVDSPPDVEVVAGDDVRLEAHAVSGLRGGSIYVSWYDAETNTSISTNSSISVDTTPPYALTIQNVTEGNFSYYFSVLSERTAILTNSSIVRVTVGEPLSFSYLFIRSFIQNPFSSLNSVPDL